MKIFLNRANPSSMQGTFGMLVTERGVVLAMTGELPWRSNQRDISCFPSMEYECEWHKSPSFGWCYLIKNVPDRDDCLIHYGNWCGDVSENLKSDVKGCVLLGATVTILQGQQAVTNSRGTLKKFHAFTQKKPFTLVVT